MIRSAVTLILSLSLTVSPVASVSADELTEHALPEQALEDWFNDDSEPSVDDVNEGQLKFIAPPADEDVLTSEAVLTITASSLKTGMVSLQQCYRNLDPVAEVDVVYRYKNMKQLRIVSSANIANAKVVGSSIQLQDVAASASICVAAEVQLLEKNAADTYLISNGPYYRRFLDGYYPYHVSVTIDFPVRQLSYADISPSTRPFFALQKQPGRLLIDTWFEGVLQFEVTFTAVH